MINKYLSAIASHKVKCPSSGELVELNNFWQDQNVVIVFFRRWGCMLCKMWAKELSEISPVLKKHNIKFVGVGVEKAGLKEFIDEKYFDGELYYVEDISTYRMLGFKRFNVVTMMTSLFGTELREAFSKGNRMGLRNDMIGDGLQNGGVLLIKKGGEIIFHFVQETPADILTNMDIAKKFGLENEYMAKNVVDKQQENTVRNKCRPPTPRHAKALEDEQTGLQVVISDFLH